MRAFFPLLSDADLTEFNDVYPLSAFDNSSQRARVGTGESELRCAVCISWIHQSRVMSLIFLSLD